jgi:hypothetical protein
MCVNSLPMAKRESLYASIRFIKGVSIQPQPRG